MNELPRFFQYLDGVKEAEQGYETLQDFFLSWTFRCSIERLKGINESMNLINLYAKKALFFLIYGENNADYSAFEAPNYEDSNFLVKEVRVWRQWKKIDLFLEVEVERNNVIEKYALNIENKWYVPISDGQLARAKAETEKYYTEEEPEDRKIINLAIFRDICYERNPKNKKECVENGYKLVTVDDISEFMDTGNVKTGNALFDEYWFN